jgi:hypothetical protein
MNTDSGSMRMARSTLKSPVEAYVQAESTSERSSAGWSCRFTRAPIADRKAPRIAPLAIQPARRPDRTRQLSDTTSVPASGKARISQP